MIRKLAVISMIFMAFGLCHFAEADDIDDKIRAAGSDIKVFCPATDTRHIQWSALLYMNQVHGAEIFVAIFQPSPTFASKITSTDDGQFHLALIGRGADSVTLVDSLLAYFLDGLYPDLAIFEAESRKDSLFLASLLREIQNVSRNDATAISSLERIFVRGHSEKNPAVIFNDDEFYQKYYAKVRGVSRAFPAHGPLAYIPEPFRRYFLLNQPPTNDYTINNFLGGSGLESFRLPGLIEDWLPTGPEKRNVLRRLDSYLSSVRTAAHPWLSRSQKLDLLLTAHADINRLDDMVRYENTHLGEARFGSIIQSLKQKTFTAIEAVVGIDWEGQLELRDTPFGKVGKLTLDLQLTGPEKIELSYFKVHLAQDSSVIIDSISQIIQPHQRFFREYPIDLDRIDFTSISGDSLFFSIAIIVKGLTMNFYLPFTEYSDADIAIRFLPGYTFLTPFTEDQYTALAQPFDWQLLITKPYASEIDGRIKIDNPDGIVVGTFDDHIHMPVGITSKYYDLHFAAGRSIGYDLRSVGASLEVGGQTIAKTSADVRVVRCEIPETRDIAFVPDRDGRLEDFLRISRLSFQPFTPHSLIRATLEAYDLLIIGSDATEFYDELRQVNDRLYQFVRNGGEILILGQSFGWPHDIFEIPIYISKSIEPAPGRVVQTEHMLVSHPYVIQTRRILDHIESEPSASPAIINGGTEIVSAGEQGSYLTVFTIGEGHVIYCGLPLLELAAKLEVEAIHLTANILNFGHGN